MAWKYKRSAGVPVTAATSRAISRGNAARDQADWPLATSAYRVALKHDPGLAHIWVQLGHSLKEGGQYGPAKEAYRRAAELRPNDPAPFLHLGHLEKGRRDFVSAAKYYVHALRNGTCDTGIVSSLHHVLARTGDRIRVPLLAALRGMLAADDDEVERHVVEEPEPRAELARKPVLVFDVSDLVHYFTHFRLPTGIQRVQIQTIRHALQRPDCAVRICCMTEHRDEWLEIGSSAFLRLTGLSSDGGTGSDPAWLYELHKLHLRLATAEPYVFPRGAYLINLGSSWQLHNYFLHIRQAKLLYGIRYVPFVHDLIPILMPEFFVRDLVQEFRDWTVGLFDHADHYLVNSENTRRDLLVTAAALGRKLGAADIAVVPLNADFRLSTDISLPPAGLTQWGLVAGGFVLMVGTVEPRKGHETALDAWEAMIRRRGAEVVPKLVCVGKRGWLSSQVFDRLNDGGLLSGHVVMLSGVSDGDLALFYRSCLFTLYPSLYEGWGLPVTESLCYGKVVVTTTAASLPEAGLQFACYVPPGDTAALAMTAERLIFEPDFREALERTIAAGFRPRSWSDIARQIEEDLICLAFSQGAGAPKAAVPLARPGASYSLAQGVSLTIWHGAGSGEAFRAGVGWHWPEREACFVRDEGGELAIRLPAGRLLLRVGIYLLGSNTWDCDWHIQVRHGPHLHGTLRHHQRQWVTFDYPVVDDGDVLRLQLRGDWPKGDDTVPEPDRRTVGIAAFFLHECSDATSRARILEAIAMGNLDRLDGFAEPPSTADDPPDNAAFRTLRG